MICRLVPLVWGQQGQIINIDRGTQGRIIAPPHRGLLLGPPAASGHMKGYELGGGNGDIRPKTEKDRNWKCANTI